MLCLCRDVNEGECAMRNAHYVLTSPVWATRRDVASATHAPRCVAVDEQVGECDRAGERDGMQLQPGQTEDQKFPGEFARSSFEDERERTLPE